MADRILAVRLQRLLQPLIGLSSAAYGSGIAVYNTDIIPVSLNALLYFAEETLSRLYGLPGNANEDDGFFCDYNFKTGEPTRVVSLAAS